jgi:hypothetical protein
MKKILAITAASLCMLVSCKKEIVIGNGNTVAEQRLLSGFTKVAVSGKTDVFVSQGAAFKIEVKAYSNLLPQLETKVVGNVLQIGYKDGTSVSNDNSEVTITMPVLSGFSTTGSSNIAINNGATTDFEATITGSSTISAFNFTTQNSTVNIEGTGTVELSVTDRLKAKITGSGNVFYKGSPFSISTDITGTGKVEKK